MAKNGSKSETKLQQRQCRIGSRRPRPRRSHVSRGGRAESIGFIQDQGNARAPSGRPEAQLAQVGLAQLVLRHPEVPLPVLRRARRRQVGVRVRRKGPLQVHRVQAHRRLPPMS